MSIEVRCPQTLTTIQAKQLLVELGRATVQAERLNLAILRDGQLTEAEMGAMLDVYTEFGQ